MRRKIGPADISYCSTNCRNESCKRNLNYYKPPFRYFSCTHFDTKNKDEFHITCKNRLANISGTKTQLGFGPPMDREGGM